MVVANPVVVIAQRHIDGEVLPCARDRHVEETSFFFKTLGGAEGHVGREVSVCRVDDVHGVELEPLRRMDGRKDEPVFVHHRGTSEVARGVRRVERLRGGNVAESRGVGTGQDQRSEILQARYRVFVTSLQ